jgi:hypothetical protein
LADIQNASWAVGTDADLTQGADFDCPIENLTTFIADNGSQGVQLGQKIAAPWVKSASAPTALAKSVKSVGLGGTIA